MTHDPKQQRFEFALGIETPSVFSEYLDQVANRPPLLRYRAIAQYGNKGGQSLYTHILNGITVLEQLRELVGLDDVETRVLFSAYTLHDLNKNDTSRKSYGDLVTPERIHAEVAELELALFFPDYARYVDAIVVLARSHSAHFHHGLERLDLNRAYGLPIERIDELVHLIRAVDNLDLAHSLDDHSHLDKFLSELNAVTDVQYTFVRHRLGEHRGLLTNLIHNAVVTTLRGRGLVPLLFFPDGVAYLGPRGGQLAVDDGLLERVATGVSNAIGGMTARKFEQFIDVRPLGIRVAPKCLELGLPFYKLWQVVNTIIQRRTFKPDVLAENARRRLSEQRAAALAPAQRAAYDALLAGPLIATSQERLRAAEHLRTYYIFLNEHFKTSVKEPWARIYDLFGLPAERRPLYEQFDARQDRAYVLIDDLTLPYDQLVERIEEDGATLLGDRPHDDPRVGLFVAYLRFALRLDAPGQPAPDFAEHLAQYVAGQHRQCATCSSPFATAEWMKPDVRSEIPVNAFSNRLRGGPGEPKKRVCPICQLQFLLEKLAYDEVSGEHLVYLHLFPYSFLTAPFIEGLRATVRRVTAEDDQARALFLRPEEWIQHNDSQPLRFVARTSKGTPHPYGLYVPRYAESIANLIIMPLNPPGGNATERFLYALQQAMLLGRHLGLKVLLSESPVPPLAAESVGDLYIDNPPLACRGLIDRNDFRHFRDTQGAAPGALPRLWAQVQALQRVKAALALVGSERDPLVELSRALGDHALMVFYVADRLLEERIRKDRRARQPEFLRQQLASGMLADLRTLALTRGDSTVADLSDHLQQLAELAAEHNLKNKGITKNSLMTPLDEVFKKLNRRSAAFDDKAIQAVIANDIFEYLQRIAGTGYEPGLRKREGIQRFVTLFFDEVYGGIYKRNLARLLADERMLRSAFYFYVQASYSRKWAARRAAKQAAGHNKDDDAVDEDES